MRHYRFTGRAGKHVYQISVSARNRYQLIRLYDRVPPEAVPVQKLPYHPTRISINQPPINN